MSEKIFLIVFLCVAGFNYVAGQNTEKETNRFELQESSLLPSSDGWGYTFANLQNDMISWKQNSFVTIDTIGFSVQNRPIIRVNVTKNNLPDNQLKRISIHARTHPAEVQSSYLANEIIGILTSGSILSENLLNECVFDIVPMYNPDGVELGLARTNYNLVDIEGGWDLDSPQPEVESLRRTYGLYMKSPNPVRIALNLHSSIACDRHFVFHHSNGTSLDYSEDEKRFIGNIRNYWPEGIMDWNREVTWINGTPTVYPESWFWVNYHESVMALTFEDMNCDQAGYYNKTADAILKGILDYLNGTTKVGIAEQPSFDMYPNPVFAGSSLYINLSDPEFSPDFVELYDLQGKRVSIPRLVKAGDRYNIVVPDLPSGLYLISIRSNGKLLNRKIVIQNTK